MNASNEDEESESAELSAGGGSKNADINDTEIN